MEALTHAISFDYTSVRELEFDRVPKVLQSLILSDLEGSFCPCVVIVYWEAAWCRVHLQSGPAENPRAEPKPEGPEAEATRFTMDHNGMALTFGLESVTLVLSVASSSCPVCHCPMTAPPHESDWSTHMANHIELRYCSECCDRVTGEPAAHEHQSRKAPIRPRPRLLEQRGEDPPFVCHYCQAFLPTRCALAEHVGTHNVLRRFMCGTCGRQYATVSSLNRHRRQHFRLRPPEQLRCRTCGQNFRKCLRQYFLHVSKSHKSQRKMCHLCSKCPLLCPLPASNAPPPPSAGRAFSLIGRVRRHVQEAHFSRTVRDAAPQLSGNDASSPSLPAPALVMMPGEVLVLPGAPQPPDLDDCSNCSFSSALLASPSKFLAAARPPPDARQPP